jgi:hypothetical protein
MSLSEGIQRSKPFMDGTAEPLGAPVAVNLKAILMELGNRLVMDQGWTPAAGKWWDRVPEGEHTGLVAALTKQINDRPEMRRVLSEMGIEWPVVEEVD